MPSAPATTETLEGTLDKPGTVDTSDRPDSPTKSGAPGRPAVPSMPGMTDMVIPCKVHWIKTGVGKLATNLEIENKRWLHSQVNHD